MVRPLLLRTNSSSLSDAHMSSTSRPGSPSSSRPPITPQNAHFWDSYFPTSGAPEGLVAGMQTPPIGGGGLTDHVMLAPFPGRRSLLRRNSSLSSMASSIDGERDDDEDDEESDWTAEEEDLVRRVSVACPPTSPHSFLGSTPDSFPPSLQTYDAYLIKHATIEAPFARTGPPPSNFTNLVARAVLRGGARVPPTRRSAAARKATFFSESADTSDAETRSDNKWRHSLRSTRLKILELGALHLRPLPVSEVHPVAHQPSYDRAAKERQEPAAVEATPRQCDDPDATPKRRKALTRNDSMDFLPDVQVAASIARCVPACPPPSAHSGRLT